MSVGALYSPASSVVSVRATPLCVSKTVTVAPDTTPPLWSVTDPRIRPKLPCAKAGRQSKSVPNTTTPNRTYFWKSTPRAFSPIECKELIFGPPIQKDISIPEPKCLAVKHRRARRYFEFDVYPANTRSHPDQK